MLVNMNQLYLLKCSLRHWLKQGNTHTLQIAEVVVFWPHNEKKGWYKNVDNDRNKDNAGHDRRQEEKMVRLSEARWC